MRFRRNGLPDSVFGYIQRRWTGRLSFYTGIWNFREDLPWCSKALFRLPFESSVLKAGEGMGFWQTFDLIVDAAAMTSGITLGRFHNKK
jgi:hypothetical protein